MTPKAKSFMAIKEVSKLDFTNILNVFVLCESHLMKSFCNRVKCMVSLSPSSLSSQDLQANSFCFRHANHYSNSAWDLSFYNNSSPIFPSLSIKGAWTLYFLNMDLRTRCPILVDAYMINKPLLIPN